MFVLLVCDVSLIKNCLLINNILLLLRCFWWFMWKIGWLVNSGLMVFILFWWFGVLGWVIIVSFGIIIVVFLIKWVFGKVGVVGKIVIFRLSCSKVLI